MSSLPGVVAQASGGDAGRRGTPTCFLDAQEPNPAQDRYSDPDGDGANHLDELLAGASLSVADNDADHDGLATTGIAGTSRRWPDAPADHPDADGLSNVVEQGLGTHPGRTNVIRDLDGLP